MSHHDFKHLWHVYYAKCVYSSIYSKMNKRLIEKYLKATKNSKRQRLKPNRKKCWERQSNKYAKLLMLDRSFIDRVIAGKSSPIEVDDVIDAWHICDSVVPMQSFIGLNDQEYNTWINSGNFSDIVIKRNPHANFNG